MSEGRQDGNTCDLTVPTALTLNMTGGPAAGMTVAAPAGCLHLIVSRIKTAKAGTAKLHIKDPKVSEEHATISWCGRDWRLQDLGSSNGTQHNNQVLESLTEAVNLSDGDTLVFGGTSTCTVRVTQRTVADMSIEEVFGCLAGAMTHSVQDALHGHTQELHRLCQAEAAPVQLTA